MVGLRGLYRDLVNFVSFVGANSRSSSIGGSSSLAVVIVSVAAAAASMNFAMLYPSLNQDVTHTEIDRQTVKVWRSHSHPDCDHNTYIYLKLS